MTLTIGGRRVVAVKSTLISAVVLTFAAGLLGGASRDARTALIVVELLSLPVGAMALRDLFRHGVPARIGWALGCIVAVLAIPILQSIPLPAELWLKAPGLAPRFSALTAAGAGLGWRPLSLDPAATFAAIPALFPPITMFLVTSSLGIRERGAVVVGWIMVALSGLVLGLAQITQQDGGWAYPYAVTNTGSLVGWFANRNHEAAILLALIPPAAVLAIGRGWTRWIGGGFLLMAVVAIGVVKSRAGIIVLAPVIVLTAVILLRRWKEVRRRWAIAAAAAVAVVAILAVALTPILDRFGPDTDPEFRYRAWPLIWREAFHHLPFGSGVGSFDRVYRAVEPLSFVTPKFFNHAHNDGLELWLEAGWMGVATLVAIVAWFLRAVTRAWSAAGSSTERAAGVGVLALAAMSWVDYPLRTEAAATLFGFLLAASTSAREARRE